MEGRRDRYYYSVVVPRVLQTAETLVATKSTVRDTAKLMGVAKSTVHTDLVRRLPNVDPVLYQKVRCILDINKSERHLRGGAAYKAKHAKEARTNGKVITD